jgi:peptidoglycan/xylan/chitin deacetylase (PgdA/CDA1 family)
MGVPAAVFVVSSLVGTRSPPLHDELFQVVSEASAARGPMPAALVKALAGRYHDQDGGPKAIRETVRALLASASAADLRRMVEELRVEEGSMPPPRELATADWEALATMQRAGMIIGSHTHTHALLIHEDEATIAEELARSRAEIEAALGVVARHFAYPDGRFSPQVVHAVAAAGYQFGYTICDHRDQAKPLLTIPRVMLWEGSCTGVRGAFSPSLMHCHATSVLPFPSRCRGNHGVSSRWQSC